MTSLDSVAKMSLHWTLVAGFLYMEIGVILLLRVPFISSKYVLSTVRVNLMIAMSDH